MADFHIQNIGATVRGFDNGDGTYTVITEGSKQGSKPSIVTMEAREVGQKYGKYLNKTLEKDIFSPSSSYINDPIKQAVKDITAPYYALNEQDVKKYERMVNVLEQKLAQEYQREQALGIAHKPNGNPFSQNYGKERPRLCYTA